MRTTLVSIEDYLNTAYSPDCEYLDGAVVERHVGERPHSLVQGNLVFLFRSRYPQLFVWPEQRLRTVHNHARIPDVCVTVDDPRIDVFEAAPLACIEILSRRDEMTDVLEKLDEYRTIGVPNIWVIDPRRKKLFAYDSGLVEAEELTITVPSGPEVKFSLSDVFRGL